ncbi:MAG: 16S rRNA (cytidine(1402)-2'-O)-methyltransferase [Desulfobulbaceae bacterium]|nr:MAG: 16S rRNA (cytidine(1402)-2'-O)-methyltransferase [Desulfobulbaceae bacterium]
MTGTLYIVATPIGNLADMTFRAIDTLKQVDVIAAEDTRHTRKLLTHFDISTRLISCYREKEFERSQEIISLLKEGQHVALVSDAGTPAISDPGAILVGEARKQQIEIIPIPGPSAVTTAMSCAGIEESGFLFLGFAPPKDAQRKRFLKSYVSFPLPLVFYESPHRIKKFIASALETFGDRRVFWARELTKKYEELEDTSLKSLADGIDQEKIRGELVVIIHPGSVAEPEGENLEEILTWYYERQEYSMKDACRKIAQDLGLSRSDVYQQALIIWKKK